MPFRVTSLYVIVVVAAMAVGTTPAMANGGTIQLSNRPAGPYAVTVYTSPTPIRAGTSDVSVMVQRAGSDELVNDARVVVQAQPIGRDGGLSSYQATHEQATNKLFYAANVALPSEGRWRIGVQVEAAAGLGEVDFETDVAPAGLLDSPLLLVQLVALPLILAVLWLGSRKLSKG
ncbi:MAG TPA: hypothetical protein VHS06_07955 [Chloroflexota bacterium]|nr:hypothetical protein [Chloroflexota bacterium]